MPLAGLARKWGRMAEAETDAENYEGEATSAGHRRVLLRILLVLLVIFTSIVAAVWFSREEIADNLIASQLESYGIPATYEIDSIGPERQILKNIVIGNPDSPDLTIANAQVAINYRFGIPALGRITLIRPRLYGSVRDGRLSFGTLDKALFSGRSSQSGLPALDLRLIDGRGLIESDFGPIGIKAEGQGRLDNGFKGTLAAVAPKIEGGQCKAQGSSMYGTLTTQGSKPHFTGPVRIAELDCPSQQIALKGVALLTDVTADSVLSGFEGKAKLQTGALNATDTRASGLNGTVRAVWRNDALTANYTLAARGLSLPEVRVAVMTLDGSLRASDAFGRVEIRSGVAGNGVRLGDTFDAKLATAEHSAKDTLVAPLLAQIRNALLREGRASRFVADITARRTGEAANVVIPQASLRGGSGSTLLSLSQVQVSWGGGKRRQFSGNLATGGKGLPRIVGRMEGGQGGRAVLRMRMAEYVSGDSRMAIPELAIIQSDAGAIEFRGRVSASGPLPGGSARNLLLPIEGSWSGVRGLALWRHCTKVGFDGLTMASLSLERRSLTLCPTKDAPIVQQRAGALQIAAGVASLDLAGTLANTPIRLKSGPIGFAYPGAMTAREVDVGLGARGSSNDFRISNLQATFGREIAGTFADADVKLYSVPLDMIGAAGDWKYANGILTLSDGRFRLEDRASPDRFNPLDAETASLTLKDSVVYATASLRAPDSHREVADVSIAHNLVNSTGAADLTVKGLVFDKALQPDQLTDLALGVVANAKGTVRGVGRIDWNAKGITSSGRFSSDALDFAAAFGPVKGASGTVVFTDLLGMTTAPNQTLQIASVNPGIEVDNGSVTFTLKNGQDLAVAGGTWPFMGGTITLHPTKMRFGASEERRYVFEIVGLDAAQFIQRMELENLAATGIFDGTVPIVFDRNGVGRIDHGMLIARTPGGNVSYLGELTYKDKGAIANFAFDVLKSIDYSQMVLTMEGRLTGEIITHVSLDGVRQGEGAKQNFLTRRIAALPIRLNVNISAPFYQLISSIKAMYDPASVRDPRDLGLVSSDGTRLKPAVSLPSSTGSPHDVLPKKTPVQPKESENRP